MDCERGGTSSKGASFLPSLHSLYPLLTQCRIDVQIYDSHLSKHSRTNAPLPLSGPPPPNFTNLVARSVLRSQNAPGRVTKAPTRSAATKKVKPAFFSGSSASGSDGEEEELLEAGEEEVQMFAPAPSWPHSLRSTRQKIVELAMREQEQDTYHFHQQLEATPRQGDLDETPRRNGGGRRTAMVRQDSMDFLPDDLRNAGSISRYVHFSSSSLLAFFFLRTELTFSDDEQAK
jgi:hypothetical protein